MYVFSSAAEDISMSYQNENYKMYFTKYVLLNLPAQNLHNPGGTQAQQIYWDFASFSTIAPNLASTYEDRFIESLRNYVSNMEISMLGSMLNNTEYYYDNTSLSTPSEKIFFKWLKELNVIDFDPAIPTDQYFSNLPEFVSQNISDTSYFQEYLWQERQSTSLVVSAYQQSSSPNFPNNLELLLSKNGNLRAGDVIQMMTFSSAGIQNDVFGSATWSTITTTVLEVDTISGSQSIIVDILSTDSLTSETTGTVQLVYNKLVQYIGEVNGVSNVQEATKAYTEVYAHIPDNTGQTPDILFRTMADVNYKPGLAFPIIPNQYQPEIVGAELFASPIVSNPQNYPGSYYGQFDTPDFTYLVQNGDSLRRSGQYYGVSGDTHNPVVSGNTIDGINVDFNLSHYAKANILNRSVSTFDAFDAMQVNNMPPKDFQFNAILWYYAVEDMNGNVATNLYGVSFLDNPNNNQNPSLVGIQFPQWNKLVTNGSQDGTSYAFGLNLNFNVINENPIEAYNPEAINSLFSMNLFNETMRRLSSLNDSFLNIVSQNTSTNQQISDLQQLLYAQTDLDTISSQIANLESLLNMYSSLQIVSSNSVQVGFLNTTPSTIQLTNIDPNYYSVNQFNTTQMYNANGSIPINVTPPTNKNFLVNIINDDNVSLNLPNNQHLSLTLTTDLDYKQTVDILIDASDTATQNKKLDIFVTTINPLNSGTSSGTSSVSSTASTPPIQTLIVGDIDLPILYNINTSQPNSAATWKGFGFDIDFTQPIQLIPGNFLQFSLDSNPLIIGNSIKVGDTLVLNNLFIGTVSTFDFSGQYTVSSVVGATVSLDVNINQSFVSYVTGSLPLSIHGSTSSILANSPYLSLNKGYMIKITRVSNLDDIALSEKYFVDVRDLTY